MVGQDPLTDIVYYGGRNMNVKVYNKAGDLREMWTSDLDDDFALYRLWKCPDTPKKHCREKRGESHRE